MRFWKGEALGNDYIVVDAADAGPDLDGEAARRLCDRHRGVGGDGVLVADTAAEPVALRIFNPDGSEAEKSGNGLRILGAWLHVRGLVGEAPFRVALPGETVELAIRSTAADGSRTVRVAMGTASFRAADLPYTGPAADGEVMGAPLEVGDDRVVVHLVSLGNPHCVLFDPAPELDPASFHPLAARLQRLPVFPRGVNVQLARVAAPDTLEALIHERGAGETLASGSSACAVVAAALRSGRVSGDAFQVRMPGGAVTVEVDDAWRVRLTGPARIVFEGQTLDAG